MKRSNNNRKRHNKRRGGRRSAPSEGLGRKSSTIISNRLEIPAGISGATFTVAELLKSYFDEKRLVKIYKLAIKLQPLNINTPYYQVQALVTLDEPGAELVALTHITQGGIYSKRMAVTIAQPRRFWVLDKNDTFKFLDLRFQTFASVTLMAEIETYFHIEIDELTPLSMKQLTIYDDQSEEDNNYEVIQQAQKPQSSSTPRKR